MKHKLLLKNNLYIYICISKNHGNEEETGFPGEKATFDLGLKVNHQRKG